MTLSTDTQTPTQATGQTQHRRTAERGRLVAYGAGLALVAALGALWAVGDSSYGTDDGPSSTYARPLEALNGQSLAAYLAAHQADRLAR
jgi:hypothetical protein